MWRTMPTGLSSCAPGTTIDCRRPALASTSGVVTPDTVELIVAEGQVTVLYSAREGPDTPAYLRLRNNMTSEDTTIDALEVADVEPGLHFVHKIDATRPGRRVGEELPPARRTGFRWPNSAEKREYLNGRSSGRAAMGC